MVHSSSFSSFFYYCLSTNVFPAVDLARYQETTHLGQNRWKIRPPPLTPSQGWGLLRQGEGGMHVPSLNVKSSHFTYWRGGHVAFSISLLYLQFSLLPLQFQHIFMSFIALSFVFSLFQVHVACLKLFYPNRASRVEKVAHFDLQAASSLITERSRGGGWVCSASSIVLCSSL